MKVFDWRDDPMGTVIAVPEVRARFMRFEPGRESSGSGGWHTHEESEGVEVFVVLEGTLRFEVDGQEAIVSAGQALVAYPHQKHRAPTCVGDHPATLYLTVTPHRQPTHTYYDAAGNRLPSRPTGGNYRWRGEPALGEFKPD